MDEYGYAPPAPLQSEPVGATVDLSTWFTARAGHALDTLVDRTLNQSQMLQDPSQAYGMDENGNIYPLGQPAQRSTMPVGGRVNPMMLGIAVILIVLIAKG